MRKEKQLLLDEISQKIGDSTALIVTRYGKLEPNASWELRNKLTESGSVFEVVKKRLLLKAAKQAGIEIDEKLLEGHIGVVFVQQTDAIASAKAVSKFSEANDNVLEMVCGQIEGIMYGGADVQEMSRLPGIQELRSQFIALLVAPMSGLLSVLEAVMTEPLSVIEQKSQKE